MRPNSSKRSLFSSRDNARESDEFSISSIAMHTGRRCEAVTHAAFRFRYGGLAALILRERPRFLNCGRLGHHVCGGHPAGLQRLCTISSTVRVVEYFRFFVGAEAAVAGFARDIWRRGDTVADVNVP